MTTQLLPSGRLHRQRRLVAASVVSCIAILSVAGWVTSARGHDTPPATRPAPVIIIWTASPAPSATAAPTMTPLPTATSMPTAEPVIVTVVVERTVFVEVESAPQVTQPIEAEVFPTVAEVGPPAMNPGESLGDYAARVAGQQHQFGRP